MISKIQALRDFGIYRNYSWPSELPEFGRYNLVYGWNYSGKTTLSRVFASLEHKRLTQDYSSATFRLELDDGSSITASNLAVAPITRVFNRDYVVANFSLEHSSSAVFVLGKTSVDLTAKLKRHNDRITLLDSYVDEYVQSSRSLNEENDRAATTIAREVRTLIGDARFESPRLKGIMGDVRDDPSAHILLEEQVQGHVTTVKSGEQFTAIAKPTLTLPDLQAVFDRVNVTLSKTASNQAIVRLTESSLLEQWVREGLKLHIEEHVCEFCGAKLEKSRMEELGAHFSEAYESLLAELKESRDRLRSLIPNLELPKESAILPVLRASYAEAIDSLVDWQLWARKLCDELLLLIEKKIASIEEPFRWSGSLVRSPKGDECLASITNAISSHNNMIADLESSKKDSTNAIGRHYAAKYFIDEDIEEDEKEIERLQDQRKRAQEIRENIRSAAHAIELIVDKAVVGAEKLNRYLQFLLPTNNIEVRSVESSKFQFLREGIVARNLSEGEKTAVAFSHFLTSLEEEGLQLQDCIVFVDDPISSLDSNHVYAVFALIVETLKPCKQVFVATHNSELFNLLKEEWRGRHDYRTYLVSRMVGPDDKAYVTLGALPSPLREFKSEYHYIFSLLFAFASANPPPIHVAYTMPNLLRKFLEAYLGFRKVDEPKWSNKLDLILDDSVAIRTVQKFADDASHLQSLDRALNQPDYPQQAQHAVMLVLTGMQLKDQIHYDSLVAKVT